MRGVAAAGGTPGAAGDAGDLFRVHAGLDCDWFWVCFLSAAGHAEMVSGVFVFSGTRRGEFIFMSSSHASIRRNSPSKSQSGKSVCRRSNVTVLTSRAYPV